MTDTARARLHAHCVSYFEAVMREDMAGVRSRFTPSAKITIFHGDNPKREFHLADLDGPNSLIHFYGHLWANYQVKFRDFTYTIDPPANEGACYFIVTLTPKPGSAYAATGPLLLNNCNFFKFENGVIASMIIYYANPTLGATLGNTQGAPTAFPKA
ncbi:MAG: nuclear transport factor 2 family protein [Alphaproteobacteria bacterium]|nr:nuclear transport factor 2 family protein [Alphaproteobacteria bacterium]